MKYIILKNVNFYRTQYALQTVSLRSSPLKIPLKHLLLEEERQMYKEDLDKIITYVNPQYPAKRFEYLSDSYAEYLTIGIED